MARYTSIVAHDDDDWQYTTGLPGSILHGGNTIHARYTVLAGGPPWTLAQSYAEANIDTSAVTGTILRAYLRYSGSMTTTPTGLTPKYIVYIGTYKWWDSTSTPPAINEPGAWYYTAGELDASAIAQINKTGKTLVSFRTNRPVLVASNEHDWSILAREGAMSPGGATVLLIETAERRYRCTVR